MIGVVLSWYGGLPATVRNRLGRALRSLAVVLLASALLVAGYLIAFRDGQASGRRERAAEIDALNADAAQREVVQVRALAKAHAQAWTDYSAQVERGNRLDARLQEQKDFAARDRAQLLRRIDRVTREYISAPGAAPQSLPAAVFTAGFVRDYNLALGVSAPEAIAAAGIGDATLRAAGADAELLATALRPEDILAHIADYGERCRGIEGQVNALIDAAQPQEVKP
ncbi:hypothetical protein [Lysobacter sp. CA199]|uniref:hypothetical protein n=1 Tax=Lysobacter sp. CA199 TaxID=3455608 RepID=UPI003F8D4188